MCGSHHRMSEVPIVNTLISLSRFLQKLLFLSHCVLSHLTVSSLFMSFSFQLSEWEHLPQTLSLETFFSKRLQMMLLCCVCVDILHRLKQRFAKKQPDLIFTLLLPASLSILSLLVCYLSLRLSRWEESERCTISPRPKVVAILAVAGMICYSKLIPHGKWVPVLEEVKS